MILFALRRDIGLNERFPEDCSAYRQEEPALLLELGAEDYIAGKVAYTPFVQAGDIGSRILGVD